MIDILYKWYDERCYIIDKYNTRWQMKTGVRLGFISLATILYSEINWTTVTYKIKWWLASTLWCILYKSLTADRCCGHFVLMQTIVLVFGVQSIKYNWYDKEFIILITFIETVNMDETCIWVFFTHRESHTLNSL